MQNCQLCGQQSESLQSITIANSGLLENKQLCSRCYYVVLAEQTNKKPENLLCG